MTTSSELAAKIGEQFVLQVQQQLVDMALSKGRRVIVIAGPTGVGKTELSLRLAQMIGGEIVSADSMQVYRGMDIGTAKVSLAERQKIPHHLIDIREVSEGFNAYDFSKEAKVAIDGILGRDRTPIVVGGTGFYLHALMYGPPSGPPSNPAIRAQLEAESERMGPEFLYDRLQSFDPDYASTLTPNDSHKIIRALEIIELSGKRVSDFSWKKRETIPGYDFRCWFIHMPRHLLYPRLEQRCDIMLAQGLLEEVVRLDRAGIRQNNAAAQSIGYRQVLEFLDTAKTSDDYEIFVQKFKQASRHLAKRQLTWFKKEPLFRWVNTQNISPDDLLDLIAEDSRSGFPLSPPEGEWQPPRFVSGGGGDGS
jgi:tRNA dimethylallyltransferase